MNEDKCGEGCLKIGCLNVRGWGVGKFEDVCSELKEWNFDIVGMTETHLRERMQKDGSEYIMIGKGR